MSDWRLKLMYEFTEMLLSLLDKAYNRGFEDGVEAVVNAPEDYGLFSRPEEVE